jgi:hypothetical protein
LSLVVYCIKVIKLLSQIARLDPPKQRMSMMREDKGQALTGRKPRVPEALQNVFISSQRGKEATKPPPGGVAFKVFRWFPRKGSNCSKEIPFLTSSTSFSEDATDRDDDPSPITSRKSIGGTPTVRKISVCLMFFRWKIHDSPSRAVFTLLDDCEEVSATEFWASIAVPFE